MSKPDTSKTETPTTIRLADYRPSDWLIDSVDLDVSLEARRTRVRSRLSLRPSPTARSGAALVLDGEHLELESVRLDGKALSSDDYRVSEHHLTLANPPAGPFRLEIVTFVDPEANKALTGLYRSRGVYCTQCEAEGFRRISYFLDRPDVLATYTVRLEADVAEAPVLLANGNPRERGTVAGGKRHYAVWKDPHPKPCYLFAMVAGDLGSIASTFTTMSGREVDLAIYVERGKEARAHWAMDALKRSMRWDEKRYGREYDLDVFNIVAVSDFNMGAMENKGLNVFNDRLILASPETATDTMFEAIEAVVAHEYFHNWTGNRITCRDWFQLCLKEGLTVFRDQEFSADERERTVQRIADVRQLKAIQVPEDAGPLAHPVRPDSYIEINNFYTATIYEKGAELCRMIATIAGEEGFRKGLDLYFDRHDGEAATVEQFVRCFEEAANLDLGQFMRWYSQAGTPTLVCKLAWSKARKEAVLTVTQSTAATPGQPRKEAFHIPLKLGLVGGNGGDIPLVLAEGGPVADGVVHVRAATETFRFVDVPSKPVPSLLRGFSAPVDLRIDLDDRDLAFLMANDADPFNRWQAAQTYATRTIIANVEAVQAGKRPAAGSAFAKALGASLDDKKLAPAYLAELLKLPSEADIAREIGRDVDPGAIHTARRALQRAVGRALGEALEHHYEANRARGAFSAAAKAAGKRALRNVALTLLVARATPEDRDRLAAHYHDSKTMTEQAHALVLLADAGGEAAEQALAHFHERWQGDHLVIDTWLAAQAASSRDETLARVEGLLAHPAFNATAPNKLRALIGTFANANPVQFNRADGAGYRFVAERVLAIDAFNPQVAARMLGCFKSWRTLEKGRRGKAKKALQRVAGHEGLSRDSHEMVSRMLES
jgi:aminopeptidase N